MMCRNASMLSLGYKIDKLNFYIIKSPIFLKTEFTINLAKKKNFYIQKEILMLLIMEFTTQTRKQKI